LFFRFENEISQAHEKKQKNLCNEIDFCVARQLFSSITDICGYCSRFAENEHNKPRHSGLDPESPQKCALSMGLRLPESGSGQAQAAMMGTGVKCNYLCEMQKKWG